MFKRQFVSQVAALAKLPADQVKAVFAAAQEVAAEELIKTGEVRIPGLVALKVMPRAERAARNPKTGVVCMVAPGHTVKCKPVSMLSDRVSSKLAA